MPYPNVFDILDLVVATGGGNVNSPWAAVGNPNELGLYVPPLASAATVTIQAALASDGSQGAGLVDKAGTALLVLASSTGNFHVSSSDMAAVRAYPFLRVVLGTHQSQDVTFKLIRKVTGTDPTA